MSDGTVVRSLLDAVPTERAVMVLLGQRGATTLELDASLQAVSRVEAEAIVAEYELERALLRAQYTRQMLHDATDHLEGAMTRFAIVRDLLAQYMLQVTASVGRKSA